THAVDHPWPVAERVMVAVSEGRLAEPLVRATRRMAERRGAPWLAVFVETPRFHQRPAEERERVARTLRLAESLGAEAVTIPGQNVAQELARYARTRHATQIVLGKPAGHGRRLWARSTLTAVIRASSGIDVRVITGERPAGTPQAAAPVPDGSSSPIGGYVMAIASVAVALAAGRLLRWSLDLPNVDMVFLMAVLSTALVRGLLPSVRAAVLRLLVSAFFFVEPIYTFTVTKPQDVLSMLVFLLVAVATSNLTSRVRDQAAAARRREARTAALYAFSRAIAGAVS